MALTDQYKTLNRTHNMTVTLEHALLENQVTHTQINEKLIIMYGQLVRVSRLTLHGLPKWVNITQYSQFI